MRKCKCGCNKYTKWNIIKNRYNYFISGHNLKLFKKKPWMSKLMKVNNPMFKIEVRNKLSILKSGKNNHMYGKLSARRGVVLSDKTKKLVSLNHADMSGKNNPMYGKKMTEHVKKALLKSHIGKPLSTAWKNKLSEVLSGKNNPAWQGGKSFEPYGIEFNNSLKKLIRQRDNYCCRFCNKKEINRKHSVHHIDFNKQNNDPTNLITLCLSCHIKTNTNRKQWTKLFTKMMSLDLFIIKDLDKKIK